MNIYFSTSLKSGVKNAKSINKMINFIRSQNHTLTLRPKLPSAIDIDFFDVKTKDVVGIEFTNENTPLQDIYLLTQKRISKSDIIIAEMSYGSTGLGYDVSQGILNNKPVLVLTSDEEKAVGNNAIFGDKSKNIFIKPYNESNIETIVSDFLDNSKKLLDSKFILIIPPEIERYLAWATKKKGVSKAEITRAAIEKYIDHDIDYKKYMSDLDK